MCVYIHACAGMASLPHIYVYVFLYKYPYYAHIFGQKTEIAQWNMDGYKDNCKLMIKKTTRWFVYSCIISQIRSRNNHHSGVRREKGL